MNKKAKPIGIKNAYSAAEKFVLGKYPYSNLAFDRIELRNTGELEVYELQGFCKLSKWPHAVGMKSQCQIQVDAYSANIVEYHGI